MEKTKLTKKIWNSEKKNLISVNELKEKKNCNWVIKKMHPLQTGPYYNNPWSCYLFNQNNIITITIIIITTTIVKYDVRDFMHYTI